MTKRTEFHIPCCFCLWCVYWEKYTKLDMVSEKGAASRTNFTWKNPIKIINKVRVRYDHVFSQMINSHRPSRTPLKSNVHAPFVMDIALRRISKGRSVFFVVERRIVDFFAKYRKLVHENLLSFRVCLCCF